MEGYKMSQFCCLVQAPAASAEAAEQAAASAGLGLAVLAGFCRVPALAECQGVIEKAPLLLRVRGLSLPSRVTACFLVMQGA